ncbi:hypothetical protein F5883DRAFT_654445 [Diaporthe sp. PMI_573]|nr:hypothetical protein F5883DRAFT_654445 [Diaporthaceae sp. PMI_573]
MAEQKKKVVVPWMLTQVSREYNIVWGSLYYARTMHRICIPQLDDYILTFLGAEQEVVPESRRNPPAHSATVLFTAETVGQVSLHKLWEIGSEFSRFESDFGLRMPHDDGWGKHDDGRRKKKKWWSVYKKLHELCGNGSIRELLPGSRGAEKMEGFFFDRDMNIQLHPTPEYLSRNPALDTAVRDTLFHLWCSAAISSIHIRILRQDGKKGIRKEEKHCKLTDPFWQTWPYRNHIRSVQQQQFDFDKGNHDSGYSFILTPVTYFLPEGYNLKDIGINKKQYAAGFANVYIEMVSPKDDEFDIRFEGPHEFFYDQKDEDFTMPVDENDTMMEDTAEDAASSVNDDDDSERSDDDEEQGEEEDGPMLSQLREDMKIPLKVLRERHEEILKQA